MAASRHFVSIHRHQEISRWLVQCFLKTLGHDVKGIEPNKGYAEYSIREYGLNVQVGFVQDVMLHEESFDLITIWHVLEHTENPCAVLTKLHTLLKPQGVLVIEVPNIEATCQSPKSTFHEAHIFNFNTATLQKLAEKAGFAQMELSISADGGNITMFVQKASVTTNNKCEINIPGNSKRIADIVRDHTFFSHYLAAHPYARLLRRIRHSFLEKRGITNFAGGKQLLDKLYSPLLALELESTAVRLIGEEKLPAYCKPGDTKKHC